MNALAMQSTESSGTFSAAGVTYQMAGLDDDWAIRDLVRRNDMDSWVRVSIEREPSFFHGENLMGKSSAVIARRSDPPHQVVGMYSLAVQQTHVNGDPVETGYLGALRVNPEYRHRLRILKNGFASARALSDIDALPVFTSLASENLAARRLLEANLRGMPCYTPVGDVESMGFSTRQGKSGGLLQCATPADIPALVEFFNAAAASYQFAPVLSRQWLTNLPGSGGLRLSDFWLLKDGARLRGCVAIWDQRAFKQIVARGYRLPLNLLLGGYNLYARLTDRLSLPRPGKQLQQAFLSFLALDTEADDSVTAIIREALMIAGRKGARVGTLGLSTKNPLANRLRDSLHASIYRTHIETIHWPDCPAPVLDRRPPQPEIALL
jgi:hypothetical protein